MAEGLLPVALFRFRFLLPVSKMGHCAVPFASPLNLASSLAADGSREDAELGAAG